MKHLLFILVLVNSILVGCKKKQPSELILGAWKIDSTYTYYNGFDQIQRERTKDWATYVYEKEGLMKELKKDASQSYFFTIKDDNIIEISATRGGAESRFEILKLDEAQMVLKKSKKPLFGGGGNQERYEIRYFSKTEALDVLSPTFNDPRKTGN